MEHTKDGLPMFNERVFFMDKHNEEEGLTIEEASKLIKELKVEKIHSNTLEEQVQVLKIEVEEQKCVEESPQKNLEESNQEREALEGK